MQYIASIIFIAIVFPSTRLPIDKNTNKQAKINLELSFLKELVIILGLSTIVVMVCQRLKIPSIMGFLLTGVLAGPHGLGLIHSIHEVEMIAEIGIVFLLFTIGIEFSFEHLLQIRRTVLQGGFLQVSLTIFAVALTFMLAGQKPSVGIFAGCLLALSSTAIVLKLMQARLEMDSPHGQIVLGILIFQDLVIVPMMLLTPLLAGKAEDPGLSLLILALKSVAVGLGVWITSKWLMPRILLQIVRTRNNELFLLSVIAICMVVAWLTSSIGLSLSLGAFLAGLIISESEYSHQAMSNILPFRDIFISFFFVSIGMLLDIHFFIANGILILGLVTGVIILKLVTGFVAATSLGYPLRTSLLSTLALSQVGEFAFVLSKSGVEFGLLSPQNYQLFLAVSICTMALTPLLISIGPRTSELVTRIPMPQRFTGKLSLPSENSPTDTGLSNHLVIIGFGVNGQNLARAARIGGIPYAILEANAKTVQDFKAQAEPIHFGDATLPLILEQVRLAQARVAVLAISDPEATRRIIKAIRGLNTQLYLIVRTRFVKEIPELLNLGADRVVPEEFETSIEIFSLVLRKYFIPEEEIIHFIKEVRADDYGVLRGLSHEKANLKDLESQGIEIYSRRLANGSVLIGQSLIESGLRQKYGISVLAIRRSENLISNPDIQMRFREGDVLVMLGRSQFPTESADLFKPEEN
jgi:monovalent cation:H+ antiporter-2, CPA2 family